jgi:hypothetical protein
MRHTLGCFSFCTGQPQSLRGADRARYGFGVPFPNKFSAIWGHKEPIRTPAFGLHSPAGEPSIVQRGRTTHAFFLAIPQRYGRPDDRKPKHKLRRVALSGAGK